MKEAKVAGELFIFLAVCTVLYGMDTGVHPSVDDITGSQYAQYAVLHTLHISPELGTTTSQFTKTFQGM